MDNLPKLYFTMETYLFPMLEEEIGELSAKMREFLRIVEVVRPSRFITRTLRWCGFGRPMNDREKMLLAFFLKAVYDLPTTKVLIENLKANPSLRRLCGWEYQGAVPSGATFFRAFKVFAEERVLDAIHEVIVKENYTEKLVGHASIDSTAIIGREKACRKNTPKIKLKRSAAAKAKRKRRHWRSRNLSKPKPGGWNFSRTGRRRKMSAICRKAVTGAANATARGKQASGAVTNCICPSATEEFRWRRF